MEFETSAGLIMAVIVERPTCLLCLAAKAGITKLDTVRAIERIGMHVALTKAERCLFCDSAVGPVYHVKM